MGSDYFVSVGGPRGDLWAGVLGTRRLPVLCPAPVPVDLHQAGRGVELCYLLDVQALDACQRGWLVAHLTERFKRPRAEVWEDVLGKGVPILAEGCSVEIRMRMVL